VMIRKGAAGSERNGQNVTAVCGKFKGRCRLPKK